MWAAILGPAPLDGAAFFDASYKSLTIPNLNVKFRGKCLCGLQRVQVADRFLVGFMNKLAVHRKPEAI